LQFSLDLATQLIDLCAGDEFFRQQGGDLFVAFRSAADPVDILNVRSSTPAISTPFGEGDAYKPLVDAYRQEAQGKLKDLPTARRRWFSGHGIGAAHALLAAVELESVAAVYTFGAPRLGDKRFVRHFPCPVFRVVNDLDVMVTMPPPWHWRHIGAQKLINADGSLNAHPQAWNRLPSLMRQTVWLGEMLAQGLSTGYPRALHTLLTKVLKDHALESYQTRLRELRK
jgi:hypothetical protein